MLNTNSQKQKNVLAANQKLSFSSSFFSHVTAVSLKELRKNKLIIILFELYYFYIYKRIQFCQMLNYELVLSSQSHLLLENWRTNARIEIQKLFPKIVLISLYSINLFSLHNVWAYGLHASFSDCSLKIPLPQINA